MNKDNPYNELERKKNTPEFKVQVVGFLLLVVTSFLFFLNGNRKIVLALLCVAFATYPISEIISIVRKKEKYLFYFRYILLSVCVMWIALCAMACIWPSYLMGAGLCFSFYITSNIFRSFILDKEK